MLKWRCLTYRMKTHLGALKERYPLLVSLAGGAVRVTATGSIADCAVPSGLREETTGVAFSTACSGAANIKAGSLPSQASFDEGGGVRLLASVCCVRSALFGLGSRSLLALRISMLVRVLPRQLGLQHLG